MGQPSPCPPPPSARRELTPVMSPPGCGVPFPTAGTRLQTERGEGGGGGEGEGSPGPAVWLVSPISRWRRRRRGKGRKGKGKQGRQPGCPQVSLEVPERPEEESGDLPRLAGGRVGGRPAPPGCAAR